MSQAPTNLRLETGRPYPLGAHWDGLGVNFAVYSAHAEAMELCLFDVAGRRERPAANGQHWDRLRRLGVTRNLCRIPVLGIGVHENCRNCMTAGASSDSCHVHLLDRV